MEKFTINVIPFRKEAPLPDDRTGYRAVIEELYDHELSEVDNEGGAVHTAPEAATALGHAMFHLSCVADLEKGAKLDITLKE